MLQIEHGAGTVIDCGGTPLLQPAVVELGLNRFDVVFTFVVTCGGRGFGGLLVETGTEPAGVNRQEEDTEVGVELVGEDRIEIELDKGLPQP